MKYQRKNRSIWPPMLALFATSCLGCHAPGAFHPPPLSQPVVPLVDRSESGEISEVPVDESGRVGSLHQASPLPPDSTNVSPLPTSQENALRSIVDSLIADQKIANEPNYSEGPEPSAADSVIQEAKVIALSETDAAVPAENGRPSEVVIQVADPIQQAIQPSNPDATTPAEFSSRNGFAIQKVEPIEAEVEAFEYRVAQVAFGIEEDSSQPIDLANSLALGGASSLEVQLARERTLEAEARWLRARALWYPSLRFGVGWTKHDGQIQETDGTISDVGRNSLFYGGGAGLGGASLTGGAGGPSRLVVNLSLADSLFEPRVAQREAWAEEFQAQAVRNDVLLEIALAYFGLQESQGEFGNAKVGLGLVSEMLDLTTQFLDAGAGSQADVDRAQAEMASWEQAVEDAKRRQQSASTQLVRLLRLGQQQSLICAEEIPVAIELVNEEIDLDVLIGEGLSYRPELAKQQALIAAASQHVREEVWRPWLPNLQAGASGGSFGGGMGSEVGNVAGRSDVDLLAVWEIENLGFGNAARRRQSDSRLEQAYLELDRMCDQVEAEVAQAADDVASYRRQIEIAERSVAAALDSYNRNYERVKEGEGLPLELLQAIRARSSSLDMRMAAIADYNRAQYRLLRAIGRPPSDPGEFSLPPLEPERLPFDNLSAPLPPLR